MLKSKVFRILLWTLALGLSGWTFFHLPAASILKTISSLSWSQWTLWYGINLVIIVLGTKRWFGLINMLDAKINFADLLFIRQAGQAISFITPGPQFGGEPLQVFWLCRNGVVLEKSILSIGLDRFFEVLINFTVLLICIFTLLFIGDLPFLKVSTPLHYEGFIRLLAIFIVVLGAFWVLLRRPSWISNRFRYLLSYCSEPPLLQKIRNLWRAIKRDFYFILSTQKSGLFKCAGISLLTWAALIGELALLLNFLHIDFNPTAFLLILIAMRLALLLPIPGGVGTLEASIFWSFQYLHWPGVAAVGLIALMRLRDIIILLFGLYCIRRVNEKQVAADATPSY